MNKKRVGIGRGRAIKLLAFSSRSAAVCLLKELTTNGGAEVTSAEYSKGVKVL